jgi:hypothetical protein
MLAIPIFGLRGVSPKPPAWLKIAAVSGLLMTLLYVILSLVPIINVDSRLSFALKIGGLIMIANALGFVIYTAAKRR